MLTVLAWLALAAAPLQAQQSTLDLPPAAPEARQFDYLLGEWTYVATTKVPGIPPTFTGTWRAWALDDGRGVMDEYRALDPAGNVAYYGVTIRTWDAEAGRWSILYIDRGMDGRWGTLQTGEARFENGEMHLEQRGDRSMLRIRYYDIQPDRFSWIADRSVDGGRTWTMGDTTIEARRVATLSAATTAGIDGP
jgi:hypothetical protein